MEVMNRSPSPGHWKTVSVTMAKAMSEPSCRPMMVMTGKWRRPGVFNVEEFDPDPFMDALNIWGLPWQENRAPVLVD